MDQPMDTEAARRKIKSSMKHTQLGMANTAECVLLPDRLHLLDRMPRNARVAEIGVAFGDFTREIRKRCAPRKLHLIDSWGSERYQEGLKLIRDEFSADIESKAVEIHVGLSVDMLAELAPATLDWAYIDTNHTYETTLSELLLCEKLVGDQGLIAGHDFCTGNVVGAIPYGVVEAVTQFCKERAWQFQYLTVESHGHFSFCLKKSWTA